MMRSLTATTRNKFSVERKTVSLEKQKQEKKKKKKKKTQQRFLQQRAVMITMNGKVTNDQQQSNHRGEMSGHGQKKEGEGNGHRANKKVNSQPESLRRLLKSEEHEAPPFLSPAVGDDSTGDPTATSEAGDSSNSRTKKPPVLLPQGGGDNQELLLDRKDEIQRLLSKVGEQEMPQLDNECQNTACGQDNGTDPDSAATSSVHSDDTPPRLTVAQVSSSFSSNVTDGEDSREEYCDDNASPPPLDKYASFAPSPVVSGSKTKDSTIWTLRLRRRPFHSASLSAAPEAGPSANKKICSEIDWGSRLAEVLGELQPSQLVFAKETIYSTVVKVLAQEITTDISCLLNLIENQDRRAAAFERILKDLKKLKSDSTYDSIH